MSVKDSFTDFHIDFGGSSVWCVAGVVVAKVMESAGEGVSYLIL